MPDTQHLLQSSLQSCRCDFHRRVRQGSAPSRSVAKCSPSRLLGFPFCVSLSHLKNYRRSELTTGKLDRLVRLLVLDSIGRKDNGILCRLCTESDPLLARQLGWMHTFVCDHLKIRMIQTPLTHHVERVENPRPAANKHHRHAVASAINRNCFGSFDFVAKQFYSFSCFGNRHRSVPSFVV